MLVSGEHVVEYANGQRALYIGRCFITSDGNVQIKETSYDDNFRYNGMHKEFEIVKVFEVDENVYGSLSRILEKAKSIWTRQEKTPQQLEYESLKEKMDEHNKVGKEMQEQLRKLGATL